jgi:hypothetical protein
MRRRAPALALAIAILPLPDRPLVDGRIGEGEWPALAPTPPATGEVVVELAEETVSLLVRTDVTMPVHLYVLDGATLSILHASASLGTGAYRQSPEGWHRTRPFVWEVRHVKLREEGAFDLAREQRAFRRRERWVASTIHPGDPAIVEWAVDRAWLERPGVRFAVSYFAGGEGAEHIRHWPAAARIVQEPAVERSLLTGELPERLELDPAGWRSLSPGTGRVASGLR